MPNRKKKTKSVQKEVVFSVLVAYGILNLLDHTPQLWNTSRRYLSKDLGDGKCKWEAPGVHNTTIQNKGWHKNTEMTIIAAHPGSGKRFIWGLVEALAGSQVGDDWDISRKGMKNIAIKTGFPHPRGIWSWDRMGNHTILVVRNPMDTFKDFHNIASEIWPAGNRKEVWAMLRDYKVYTKNYNVRAWEGHRDASITRSVDLYGWYIDFWMNNGFRRNDGKGNPYHDIRCERWMDTCVPKEVISFEKIYDYQRALPEIVKLMDVFKVAKGIVPMINDEAYDCVRGQFQAKKELHVARRYGTGPENFEKTYNHTQLIMMKDELIRIVEKYTHENYTNVTVAPPLVENMREYINMTEIERIKAFALYEGWVMMAGHDRMNYTRSQPGLWGSIDKGSYVRRICISCVNDTHKDIYYKRLTHPGTINYTHLFENHWTLNTTGGNNTFGADFTLHSTFNDAQINTNPWSFCNYSDPFNSTHNFTLTNYSFVYYHFENSTSNYSDFSNISTIGFPHECGPTSPMPNNWNSMNYDEGEQDYAFFASLYPEGWSMLYGNGALDVDDHQPKNLHQELWESIDKGSYIRRICSSCSNTTHQNIIYKRLTHRGTINFKELFLNNWVTSPTGGSNIFGTDFKLFSNLDEAQNDRNSWTFCNFDESKIAFPRHCGPKGPILDQWNSLLSKTPSQDDYAFYIYTGASVSLEGWQVLNSRGNMARPYTNFPYTQNALWETIDTGAVVRRLCASCDVMHRDIIYKRITSKGSMNMKNLFLENWHHDPEKKINNQIGVDFQIYSNVLDAENDMNAWTSCGTYNQSKIGFPGNCDKSSGTMPSNWNSITSGGQHAFAYYISKRYDNWVMISGNGTQDSLNSMPALWGAIDKGSYIKRICTSCTKKSHQNIIYKRYGSKENINMETLFLEKWFARPPGWTWYGMNIKGRDFNLFSNMGDAEADQSAWSYCNYNDHFVGFPRDCGPSGRVTEQWNSNINYGTEEDYAFYMSLKQENYVLLDGFGEMYSVDTWPNLWRSVEEGSFIRRICASCSSLSHTNIVYKRMTPPGPLNFRELFLQDWISDLSVAVTNTLNTDFSLHAHLSDAKRSINPWKFCNYNINGVGFPRECGPTEPVNDEWNSVTIKGGETDYAYYLSLDIDGWSMLAGHGIMSSRNARVELWSSIDQGSYVKRVCASCSHESHRNIIYKRLTSMGSVDSRKLFEQSWVNDPENGIKNTLGTDFNLFSTYKNSRNNAYPWLYCDYSTELGFPSNCGLTTSVNSEWNSVVRDDGEPHYAFYVSKYMDGWTMIYGKGEMSLDGTQPQLWDKIDKGSYVRRICSKCSAKSHQNIIYKRLNAKKNLDFEELFLKFWRSYPVGFSSGDASNVRDKDFNLYTNMEDAKSNTNFWLECDYNDHDVGFPRNCGPTALTYWQWNALNNKKVRQRDYAFYVYTGETPSYPGWAQIYGRGSMIPSVDNTGYWNNIGPDSIVRRVCTSCTKQYHNDIVYRRLTTKGTVSFYDLFMNNMLSNPPDNSNALGVDFNVYHDLADAQNNVRVWASCGNNVTALGANMTNVTCGPLLNESPAWKPDNRNDGETSFAFYLYVGFG